MVAAFFFYIFAITAQFHIFCKPRCKPVNQMNGTVAQAYFGLMYTISVLQKAALTKTTPLEDNTSCRSMEEATQLYDAVKLSLGAKAAG